MKKFCPVFKKECLRHKCAAYALEHGKIIKLKPRFNEDIFVKILKFEKCEIVRGYCKKFKVVITQKKIQDELK